MLASHSIQNSKVCRMSSFDYLKVPMIAGRSYWTLAIKFQNGKLVYKLNRSFVQFF